MLGPSNTETSRNCDDWPCFGCARVDLPTPRKYDCRRPHSHNLYPLMRWPEPPVPIDKYASRASKLGWNTAIYTALLQMVLHRIVKMQRWESDLWANQASVNCWRLKMPASFVHMHLFHTIRSKTDLSSQYVETAWVPTMVPKNGEFWSLIRGTSAYEFGPFHDRYPY